MWQYTEQALPPENVLLITTNGSGQINRLIRKGNLHFLPDMSMYVYYVPKMWRVAPLWKEAKW